MNTYLSNIALASGSGWPLCHLATGQWLAIGPKNQALSEQRIPWLTNTIIVCNVQIIPYNTY